MQQIKDLKGENDILINQKQLDEIKFLSLERKYNRIVEENSELKDYLNQE